MGLLEQAKLQILHLKGFSCVNSAVFIKLTTSSKRQIADCTGEWLLSCMDSDVPFQIIGLGGRKIAMCTLVRFLCGVDSLVSFKTARN